MSSSGGKSAYEIASQPRTINKGGGRQWIHAVKITGNFQKIRNVVGIVLLLLFYVTPWLQINGKPFIKLSFLESSFVLFGNYILVYEFYHFVLLALLLVLTLFLASALVGRVWCGYACPQTIFIEQVLGAIETLCEGPAIKRLADRNKPLTANRIFRKTLKHILYVLISFTFAFTLVALFTGPELLLSWDHRGAMGAIGFLTALAWFNGAYWREQFCHIVCPYARFQSVMQDAQTITIGYDSGRGEPRGRKKETTTTGDCIDCGLCVRVCPSGIDIRQGAAQLECTACARCVDACDQVMTSLDRPKGLIRYDALEVFTDGIEKTPKRRIMRPRLVLYAVAWLVIFAVGLWQFINRSALHVNLLSISGSAPYFVAEGRVKNLGTLKIGNQGESADHYSVQILSDDQNTNADFKIETPTTLGPIAPGSEGGLPILISGVQTGVGSKLKLKITSENTGQSQVVQKKFVGPGG